MQCYFCNNESVALCSYCNRGICHKHKNSGDLLVLKSPEIIKNLENEGFLPHSLWCGKCVTDYTYDIIRASLEEKKEESSTITDTIPAIENACSNCNSLNDAGDSYCKNCGSELSSELIEELSQCPNCGLRDEKLLEKAVCPECDSSLPI
jgi:predicted Zn-ribbon and HTH transcriptional regulator